MRCDNRGRECKWQSTGIFISILFQQVDDLKDEVEDLKEEVDAQATIIEDYQVNAQSDTDTPDEFEVHIPGDAIQGQFPTTQDATPKVALAPPLEDPATSE
ncbi:hypothetical protein PCASD_07869 [Puccinia coronata f. sp. avenae]|uniref:Uncharacterized protein n=1 Tax=Puccinia coronata f. sp. avenae TaxID=200324 RepID=A0A2N5UQR0_9BASI|nr:hypothetical protein PCASD_07869 [Puccinia coronata f. sp. avenae]